MNSTNNCKKDRNNETVARTGTYPEEQQITPTQTPKFTFGQLSPFSVNNLDGTNTKKSIIEIKSYD